MRILITGASGLLGAHLATYLAMNHEVIGMDRNPWWGNAPLPILREDLMEPGWIEQQVLQLNPAWVIHCAALADVDQCEQKPAQAQQLNAQITRRLAGALANCARMLYVSTDGLFQGDRPHALETWAATPRTVYGRTKWEGELAVRELVPNHLIVRTNFYGWSSGRKKTAGEWLEEALKEQREITLFHDFYFTPIYVVDLVERLKTLMDLRAQGTFHLGGRDRVSKYEFGRCLAACAGYSMDHVRVGSIEEANLLAPRPRDMSLGSERFEKLTGIPVPRCLEGIQRFLAHRGVPLEARFGQGSRSAKPEPQQAGRGLT